ncbi:MAG: glycosyltransferase, partial [Candidatus Pacearchaeota archaeon]
MITIGITAYKEEKVIGKCLDSILSQRIPFSYEIIVAAPDKRTLDVVKKYQNKYKQIKIVQDPGKGKPIALNLIFKIARGDILVLTDGDLFLGKNSIYHLIKHFSNKEVGCVSGKVIYQIKKGHLFYEWAKLSEKLFDKLRKSQAKEKKLWHPTGYLYAIRNNLIKQIPPNSLADDAVIGYLIYSKGYKINYEPKAKVFVKFPRTISDFIKQKARTRAGILQLKQFFSFKGSSLKEEISLSIKDVVKTYGIKKIFK